MSETRSRVEEDRDGRKEMGCGRHERRSPLTRMTLLVNFFCHVMPLSYRVPPSLAIVYGPFLQIQFFLFV